MVASDFSNKFKRGGRALLLFLLSNGHHRPAAAGGPSTSRNLSCWAFLETIHVLPTPKQKPPRISGFYLTRFNLFRATRATERSCIQMARRRRGGGGGGGGGRPAAAAAAEQQQQQQEQQQEAKEGSSPVDLTAMEEERREQEEGQESTRGEEASDLPQVRASQSVGRSIQTNKKDRTRVDSSHVPTIRSI